MRYKIPDEEFIQIVTESYSIAECLKKMGIIVAGGNYYTCKRRIEKLNLDISHFKGRAHNKNKINGPKRPINDYLSNKHSIQSFKLKNRLIKEKYFIHQCNRCKLTTWNNLPIPLELEHKDGNHYNNQLDNLELLCPNCHAQTSTYRGKNKKIK